MKGLMTMIAGLVGLTGASRKRNPVPRKAKKEVVRSEDSLALDKVIQNNLRLRAKAERKRKKLKRKARAGK